MGLFITKKGVNPHKWSPDAYHKHFYFNKQLCDGIELVAIIEQSSKKDAAELLMKAGLSSYMGGKITDYIEERTKALQENRPMKTYRFITMLRRWAKSRGYDISKFI